MQSESNPVLNAVGLRKDFPVSRIHRRGGSDGSVTAVRDVSLTIGHGETLGLVGESGCGKTTTAKMMLWVEPPTEGYVVFNGTNLSLATRPQMRSYRSAVQAVFQDPWSSLNPRLRVGKIVAEPMRATRSVSKSEARDRAIRLLGDVGLPPSCLERFPHEFSGGQRQRIAIARALSSQPQLVVLDEPVSALDVSLRAQIMNLLKDLQQTYGVSYLLIAHDMATVRHLSDRMAVMYLGQIVEEGATTKVMDEPKHPYTKALISASLPAHPDASRKEIVLTGEVPSPIHPPTGCPFHPRCPSAMPVCSSEIPKPVGEPSTQWVSCHLYPPAAVMRSKGSD